MKCRICSGNVREFFDLGPQPVSDAFLLPPARADEFFYRLRVGVCESCMMVQQAEEIPRQKMFHADYPYRSSGSALIRQHFAAVARRFLETELSGPDAFIVEIGSNDGVMLKTISQAGIRHLGVDPSGGAAEVSAECGVRVQVDFFDETTAGTILARDGQADVIYSANTVSHISYLDSVFRGVDKLLADNGVFVIEDRYLGDILEQTAFDQIYDEHFYLFSVRSVRALAQLHGLELSGVEHLPVHGGTIRYTISRPGRRAISPEIARLCALEPVDFAVFEGFARRAADIRDALTTLLTGLREQGRRVVGYGATAKSATILNYCGIGPDLIPCICDSTPGKQGRLTPGSHIPVLAAESFAAPYPDYALLFAWNHAEEIMAKEQEFKRRGGRWIMYVPEVHIV
ncbi:class I SAM-dependent methyltransferase [Nonomuraea sp. NPDC046802]|uniref:class I SAM-dependent methyltransferase n=1 Tax=Nonomuraea sp. NPDC046802 TaxID=3154919 RepID=UPI0033FC3C97